MTWLTRTLGLLTAGYGVAVLARPQLLAKPCALTEADGSVPVSVAALARAAGVRDLASGVALALAPAGGPLRLAVALRTAADLSDAVLFGLALPNPTTRKRAAAGAAAWGVLCALSAVPDRAR
ncbi:hypothetical protein AB5J62_37345 [Amycolatopsis sp. cg5]|uniref:hypothetical protein n=1 Tax=Amycolatopsis sp. cg5 TaxID=3238802 RepID=UPI0035246AAD